MSLGTLFPPLDRPAPHPLRQLNFENVDATPDDIQANVRHFNKLERLSIMHNALAAYGGIWSTLHKNHIHLVALATDAIGNSGFAEYLTSYTGLRELVIKSRYLPDNEDVGQVFKVIVHQHRSLEVLHLGSRISCPNLPPTPARSIVGAQQIEITKCENLRELAIFYEFSRQDIRENNRTPVVCLLFFSAAL